MNIFDMAKLSVETGAKLRGHYKAFADGVLLDEGSNIITTEGLKYLLRVGALNQAQIATWYVALYGAAVDPAASWTAASFPATASEITSVTEGYSETTRPVWTPNTVTPATPVASNSAAPAQFTIVCTAPLTVNGVALLSSSAKGGTSGILLSARRAVPAYTLNNGTVFSVVYELSLLPEA